MEILYPVDLSIIIVSWNVRALLARCLTSIAETLQSADMPTRPFTYETIVVDNGSNDGSTDMIYHAYPWVRVIANEQNVGFSRANNQALAISRGRYNLLLNPDTEVVGQSLATMLTYMDDHPDVGAVGPQLLYSDGSVQPSRRRFPTYATAFLESTILQRWFPRHRLLRRYYLADRPDDEIQEVDWLVGACLMLRREAVDQVGLLDEQFFMYSEELDYCRRLRDAGWRLVYLPTAQVIHHEGGSSEQVAAHRLILFHTSKVQFYTKWFGRQKGEWLRLFLLVTFVFQWMEEAVKLLLGHKPALRRARLIAYREVLRSGLKPERLAAPGQPLEGSCASVC